MRQVLWNLVRNGVQASAPGATVIVTIEPEGDRVRMLVTDEGPGIPPDAVAKIFDAFYTTRSQGAGIGLAVVRRIIDDHGASIDVHSTASGATFEVVLARSAA
jgi:signal transduction histidine kinase